MRCVIARFAFDFLKTDVQQSMEGIKPEPVVGASVIISRRTYPVKQVGEVITGQNRRDFTSAEVTAALSRLGFTCRPASAFPPATAPIPLEDASGEAQAPV